MDNFYEDLGIIDEESRKRINEMLDDPGVLEAADKVVKNSTWYKKHYRMITDEEICNVTMDLVFNNQHDFTNEQLADFGLDILNYYGR